MLLSNARDILIRCIQGQTGACRKFNLANFSFSQTAKQSQLKVENEKSSSQVRELVNIHRLEETKPNPNSKVNSQQ